METFSPEANGAILLRDYTFPPQFNVVEDERELGNVNSYAVSQKGLRVFDLVYRCRDRASFEYINSFVHFQVGPAGRFFYVLPEFTSTPFGAPTLTAILGGIQPARTIFVKFAWQTALGRTRASPAASLAVPEDNLLKVTLPVFPPSVTEAAIYATEGAEGTEQEQTVIAALSWTQPDAALLTDTAAPLTENTARETITAKFAAGTYTPVRRIGPKYDVSVTIEETYS